MPVYYRITLITLSTRNITSYSIKISIPQGSKMPCDMTGLWPMLLSQPLKSTSDVSRGFRMVQQFLWKPCGPRRYCTLSFDLSNLILMWAVAKSRALNGRDINSNALQCAVAKARVRCSQGMLNLQLPMDLLGIQDHSKRKSSSVCPFRCRLPTLGLRGICGPRCGRTSKNSACVYMYEKASFRSLTALCD